MRSPILLGMLFALTAACSARAENLSCTTLPFFSEMPDYYAPCHRWEESPSDAYLLYPESWGATPDPSQRAHLHAIRETVADIKSFYTALKPMPSPLAILVTDAPPPARAGSPAAGAFEAFQDPMISPRFPNACWISTTGLGLESSPDKLKFIIAHEVAHCLVEVYAERSLADEDVVWFEGISEYIANQVYVDADYEDRYSRHYVITDNVFDAPYFNFIFFQYHGNERGGARGVLELGKTLATAADKLNLHPELSGISGIEMLWHDFIKAFVDNAIADKGPTRTDGVIARGAVNTLDADLVLDPSSGNGTLSSEANNSFAGFPQNIKLAPEGVYTIHMPESSSTALRASIKRGAGWTEMTGPLTVTTGCEDTDGEDVVLLISTTSDDLDFPTLSFDYEAIENEECEEEEPSVAGCSCSAPVDPCILGRWALAPGHRQGFMSAPGIYVDIEQMWSGSGAASNSDGSVEWDTESREVTGTAKFSPPDQVIAGFSDRGRRTFRAEMGGTPFSGVVTDAQTVTISSTFCTNRASGELCFTDMERNYSEYLFRVEVAGRTMINQTGPPPAAVVPEAAPVRLTYECTSDRLTYTLDASNSGATGIFQWVLNRSE